MQRGACRSAVTAARRPGGAGAVAGQHRASGGIDWGGPGDQGGKYDKFQLYNFTYYGYRKFEHELRRAEPARADPAMPRGTIKTGIPLWAPKGMHTSRDDTETEYRDYIETERPIETHMSTSRSWWLDGPMIKQDPPGQKGPKQVVVWNEYSGARTLRSIGPYAGLYYSGGHKGHNWQEAGIAGNVAKYDYSRWRQASLTDKAWAKIGMTLPPLDTTEELVAVDEKERERAFYEGVIIRTMRALGVSPALVDAIQIGRHLAIYLSITIFAIFAYYYTKWRHLHKGQYAGLTCENYGTLLEDRVPAGTAMYPSPYVQIMVGLKARWFGVQPIDPFEQVRKRDKYELQISEMQQAMRNYRDGVVQRLVRTELESRGVQVSGVVNGWREQAQMWHPPMFLPEHLVPAAA